MITLHHVFNVDHEVIKYTKVFKKLEKKCLIYFSFPVPLPDGELQRKDAAEERRRIKEEERRRRNLEKLQVENPSSIWDQIRNGEYSHQTKEN